MKRQPFESFAQNAEDVVLWRALGPHVPEGGGRYVEIGANDPVVDSITWAFYQRGWRGITAEPVPGLAAAHRAQRPHDVQVEAVIGALDTDEVVLHEIAASGLSTIAGDIAGKHAAAGWAVLERTVPVRRLDDVLVEAGWDDGRDIHFLTVDTEGSEPAVLGSIDLRRFRPWVLVIEATAPTSMQLTHESWEPQVLAAGYSLSLFDGLSRFYVADEHRDTLGPLLARPASPVDDFTTLGMRNLAGERDTAREQLAAVRQEAAHLTHRLGEVTRETVRWRAAALTRWTQAMGGARVGAGDSGHAQRELEAMRQTVSWRVTAPLRTVRSRAGALRARRW